MATRPIDLQAIINRDRATEAQDPSAYAKYGLPEEWIRYARTPRIPKQCKVTRRPFPFSPREYFWLPDSIFLDEGASPAMLAKIRECVGGYFFDLPLSDQCSVLSIPFSMVRAEELAGGRVSLDGIGRGGKSIEEFALGCMKADGWKGDWLEGFIETAAIRATQNRLKAMGVQYYPPIDSATGYRAERHLTVGELAALEEAVGALSEDEVVETISKAKTSLRAKLSRSGAMGREDGVRKDLASVVRGGAVKTLKEGPLAGLIRRGMEGYEVAGHPDLTLFKEDRVRFVEVKALRSSEDKFTIRQPEWIRNYALPLRLDVSVLQIDFGTKRRLSKPG